MTVVLKALRENAFGGKLDSFRLLIDCDDWLRVELGHCGYAIRLDTNGKLRCFVPAEGEFNVSHFDQAPTPPGYTYDNIFPVEWSAICKMMPLESGERLSFFSYDYGPGWKRWFVCTERSIPIVGDVEQHTESLYSVFLSFEDDNEAVRFKLTVG